MSRLDELIRNLCPEGVEYKTLGEIATDVYRGAGITREQVCEAGTPCVRYGEIYTTYGVWFEKCVSHTDETLLTSKKYFGYGDILFAITGESVEDIAKCCAYIGHETCLAGGDIVVLKHNEDPKYLAYALSTMDAQRQKSKGKVKSKVVHSSVPDIKAIKVPILPLPVQREIVHILDNFTELTAELTAELTVRRQQYAYYRDKLLDRPHDSTKIIAIGELGSWSGGKTPSMDNPDYWEDGTMPWISSKDMKVSTLKDTEDHITEKAISEASMTVYPPNGVAVVTRSGILKHTLPVAFVPFATTVNQDIKILVAGEGVLPRYAFHAIQGKSPDILAKAKKQGGTVDSLEFKKFLDYKIPLPSLEVQKRLVEVLDNFDSICTDLNIGLPAEIEARQKQYEYYRDKLLSFEEKT
ncbi:MAG: restriction endonuclease subunit S [Oscillospiraceae bacterium]